jgi:hypothetical protein
MLYPVLPVFLTQTLKATGSIVVCPLASKDRGNERAGYLNKYSGRIQENVSGGVSFSPV